MEKDLDAIVAQMTLEEKAGLCSGADLWHTKAVPRLGIPSVMMADGPHGLRKQAEEDALGLDKSVPATCFPTASALACSWDIDLIQKIGRALGDECRAQNVSILLGPGCNIKRSPLCGRNFEYYSEDPHLSSQLATAFINSVQSRGVGTSLKHFAVNNQETQRMNVDAVVDERALREIYLSSFEGAVKNAAPKTVMCAYNRLGGEYCSQNKELLTDILKNEWGFEGCVVSDWGAVADRVPGLAAGLDLEMPYSGGERDRQIAEAVLSGELPGEVLDKAVKRILKTVFDTMEYQENGYAADLEENHKLAGTAAKESVVLLKNENDLLPIKKRGKIAVIGGFAKQPRYQGAGSSHVNPACLENAYGEIIKLADAAGFQVEYAQGYRLDGQSGGIILQEFASVADEIDEALLREALETARNADVAVVFVGLPDSYETEGADRKHLRMPKGHCALIEKVAGVQRNVAVVLSNGAPVEMPWLNCAGAVLEGYLGGQGSGGAIAAVLFGDANPCGKLAETFPKKLSDTPAYLNFPGERERVEYREGLFVGYRYYDTKELEPLFPFGYGLSYTEFTYRELRLEETLENGTLTVRVTVKNKGKVSGKEIVQLYVRPSKADVIRPNKELKGFQKVSLEPGEEKEVVLTLDRRAFAYYDPSISSWHVQDGEYGILIGKSSRDIVLSASVHIAGDKIAVKEFTENSTVADILKSSDQVEKIDAILEQLHFMDYKRLQDLPALFREMPLRNLLVFTRGGLRRSEIDRILNILNHVEE